SVLHVHDQVHQVGCAERIDRHFGVVRAVFGKQDGADRAHVAVPLLVAGSSVAGRVKWKVAPRPGSDSAQTRPSCRVTTRLTLARPMPVPENSDAACRRWNTPNGLPA